MTHSTTTSVTRLAACCPRKCCAWVWLGITLWSDVLLGGDGGPVALNQTGSDRLRNAKPLYWVHVPKCGSSLINLFLLHKEICPVSAKGNKSVRPKSGPFGSFLQRFNRKMKYQWCTGSLVPDFTVHHEPVSDRAKRTGHGVIMLRQPEQRILAAYFRHGANATNPHSWPLSRPPENLREYAEQQQACSVKMLTGKVCRSWGRPSDEDVASAKQMLHENMAFVGITDKWDLSVCLFHAMFGGECHHMEFQDMHPGTLRKDKHEKYNTSELGGFRDVIDGALYEEAAQMFKKNLVLYGVSPATCPSLCSPRGLSKGRDVQRNNVESRDP